MSLKLRCSSRSRIYAISLWTTKLARALLARRWDRVSSPTLPPSTNPLGRKVSNKSPLEARGSSLEAESFFPGF